MIQPLQDPASSSQEAGERKAKLVQERFRLAGEEALKVILAERVAKGWGVPTVERYDGGGRQAVVAVRDLFECLPFQGKMAEPSSHLFRGYLAGVLTQLMENRVTVREVDCIAKGNPQCTIARRKRREP